MDRSGLQRVIPIILVIIVVIVAALALFSLGRTLFGGGDDSSSEETSVNNGKQALTNTSADRSVRMSVRGPIVAGEDFHSYTITVSPDARNMTTYVGYIGDTVDNSQLTNNTQAYTQFVNALNLAKLMDGTPLTGDTNDTNGVCATGYLYMFDVLQGTNSIQTLWTSTCKGSPGSLTANLPQVRNLFQVQIPTYGELVQKVDMN